MQIIQTFTRGLISVIKVIGSPLMYRYPYRISSEGLRSDWLSISKDIENVMLKLEEHSQHGNRPEQ